MTRAEHLQWSKDRAVKYIDAHDYKNAFASMVSDLGKHPDTADHPAIELGTMLFINGHLNSDNKMREFILGFN